MAQKENSTYKRINHGFGPCFDSESEILVLGSFPSVKSREVSFYYGHPMNRFWPLLAKLHNRDVPITKENKVSFCKDIHFALYDVIDSCDIVGSSDVSIKNAVVTDLFPILNRSKIKLIVLNGKKAGSLFEKYQAPVLNGEVPYVVLPSTSPANAAMKFETLCGKWKEALSPYCAQMRKD